MSNSHKLRLRDIFSIGLILALLVTLLAGSIGEYHDSEASSGKATPTAKTPHQAANAQTTTAPGKTTPPTKNTSPLPVTAPHSPLVAPHSVTPVFTNTLTVTNNSGNFNIPGSFANILRNIVDNGDTGCNTGVLNPNGYHIIFASTVMTIPPQSDSAPYYICAPVWIDGSVNHPSANVAIQTVSGQTVSLFLADNSNDGSGQPVGQSRFNNLTLLNIGGGSIGLQVQHGDSNQFNNLKFNDQNDLPESQTYGGSALLLQTNGNTVTNNIFYDAKSGVTVLGGSNVVQTNSFIKTGGNGQSGLDIVGYPNNQALGNTFSNPTGSAIEVKNAAAINNLISGNILNLATGFDGILINTQASKNTVSSNTISSSHNAVVINQSGNNFIINNTINTNVNSGIKIIGAANINATTYPSVGNSIISNTIGIAPGTATDCDKSGIWLESLGNYTSSSDPSSNVYSTSILSNRITSPRAVVALSDYNNTLATCGRGDNLTYPQSPPTNSFDYPDLGEPYPNYNPATHNIQGVSVSPNGGSSYTLSGVSGTANQDGALVQIFRTSPANSYVSYLVTPASNPITSVNAIGDLLGSATIQGGTWSATINVNGGDYVSLSQTYTGTVAGKSPGTSQLSPPVQVAPTPNATTTTLTSAPNPSVFGQPVVFTATVTSSGGGTPTGTVGLQENSVTLITTTLNASGIVTFTLTNLNVGSHQISANYSGDATFGSSNSPALTQVVTKASTSTALDSAPNPATFGQTVFLTATVTVQSPGAGTPAGSVVFQDNGSPIGSAGLDNSGQAYFSTANLSVGNHNLTAVYNGDSHFLTSTSPVLNETINPASTALTLVSSPNPSNPAQPVVFTATLSVVPPGAGAPSGVVTFTDNFQGNPTVIGTATLASGVATFTTSTLPPGTHLVTASYGGNTNFGSSQSNTVSQVVNPPAANPTTTSLTSSNNPSVFGQSVTFTATVSSTFSGTLSGTVTFTIDGVNISPAVTLTNGQASYTISTLSVGSHTVLATYSGDSGFASSQSNQLNQQVNQANTNTGLVSSGSPSVVGQTVIFTATVTAASPGAGSPSGTVTFTDTSTGNVLSTVTLVAGSASVSVSNLSLGDHLIRADYSGDANFKASFGTFTQTVSPLPLATTTTSLSSSANPSVYGQVVTLTASVTSSAAGTPSGVVSFTEIINGTPTFLGSATLNANGLASFTPPLLSLGQHTFMSTYGGDSNFAGSVSPNLVQNVIQADTNITLASNPNPSSVGQSVLFTATLSVTPPGAGTPSGLVTFTDTLNNNTTPITVTSVPASGVITFNLVFTEVGIHTIQAVYGGDANFNGRATTLNQTVVAVVTATPTPTPTASVTTATPTATPSITTATPTPTPSTTGGTATPTPTPTSSVTNGTPTPTPTPSTTGGMGTPTPTSSATSGTGTPTPTSTQPTTGNTPTPTSTAPTIGSTPTPTQTNPIGNNTPTPTSTLAATATTSSNPTSTPGNGNPTSTPRPTTTPSSGNPTATASNTPVSATFPPTIIGVPLPTTTIAVILPTPTPVIIGGTPLPSPTETSTVGSGTPQPTASPTTTEPVNPTQPGASGPFALAISASSSKVNSGSAVEFVVTIANISGAPIQNVLFNSSLPSALRVTSVSPGDSTSVSNNFVLYQLASLDAGASVTVKIETVAQVNSVSESVVVPGTVTGTQNDQLARLDATSGIITIVPPSGGLPVTGGGPAPVFMGLGLLAMAFAGVRFTFRLRRLRRR